MAAEHAAQSDAQAEGLVSVRLGAQIFGVPVMKAQDIIAKTAINIIPRSPPEVAGSLNLRGRIVTLIDLGFRLGLVREDNGGPAMAIGVEMNGESYGLLIDSVGEVLKLDGAALERNPINLDPRLASVSTGIFRLDGQLLMVIDVDRILDISIHAAAA